jgi:signal transduction histidine kinase
MAGHRTAAVPTSLFHGALAWIATLPTRNIRATVLLCVVAIGGSFAAAGALQMRLDQARASQQLSYFEARRARDVAAVVETSLARYEATGRRFAADETVTLPTGMRGIAISDDLGVTRRTAGETIAMQGLAELAHDGRVVLGTSQRTIIAFKSGRDIVAASFDTSALAPASLLDDVEIIGASGAELTHVMAGPDAVSAQVADWPVEVRIGLEDSDAIAAWYGSLPLYLFVIVGPALVGAWLAVVFVGEFERRSRAAVAVRTLRSTRPAEARLLVRLATAEREAVESQRSKSEFVAHMSHELRTPLNAIIGFAEVIERGFYGAVGHPKYIEYARDIGMAGRSLHAKIGDILEFANLEAGRYPLTLVRFDVTEVVGACVNESVGRAFSRRIVLDMVPAAVVDVVADPMAVRRIIANLLSNALIYTPEGGRVLVVIREEEGAVAINISDNGNGFSPPESVVAGTAFRRFERVGVSTGAGLGLAIVVALAHRMGGALKLSSTPGEGTCAELRLPRPGLR